MSRPRFAAILTLVLATSAAWAPASLAADPPDEPAPPVAAQPPRALYASPLVTIEQIGGSGAGLFGPGTLDGDGTDGKDHLPLDLQGPQGFSSFPEIAPPDGGGLVTLVE
jgi:hypothetical protein